VKAFRVPPEAGRTGTGLSDFLKGLQACRAAYGGSAGTVRICPRWRGFRENIA
jgi:hypothetical protein